MIDAAQTWALVVGIDVYDDPGMTPLTGAVADAIAAVTWLRTLGVPDRQILLHASPSITSKPLIDGLGLGYRDARQPTITDSIGVLATQSGRRLFVFLSGHGLYEPSTERLFLTQDARPPFYHNIGIAEHTKYFLSLNFERQFLFMDGCLNLPYSDKSRPTMKAWFGGAPATPNPNNSMVACFAASVGQLAAEIAGRGAFMRRLFEVLDVNKPLAKAIDLDFATGAQTVNLGKAMDQFIIAQVEADALKQGQDQRPAYFAYEAAGTQPARFGVFELPTQKNCQLTITVAPGTAAPDVESINISFDDRPWWYRSIPQAPATAVSVPIVNALPKGYDVRASCRVNATAAWDIVRSKQQLRTDGDETVLFELSARPVPGPGGGLLGGLPSAPTGGGPGTELFTVKILGSDGFPRPALGHPGYPDDRYTDVAKLLGRTDVPTDRSDLGRGVIVNLHEDGPEFEVPETEIDHGAAIMASWSKAIRQVVPKEFRVTTTLRGARVPEQRPNLHVELAPGGARHLAGALSEIPLVSIGAPNRDLEGPLWRARLPDAGDLEMRSYGSGDMSLSDLERSPDRHVEPGPTRIFIDLPWGSWTETLDVPDNGAVTVLRLPSSIGRPPLRVALAADADGARPRFCLFDDAERRARPSEIWFSSRAHGRPMFGFFFPFPPSPDLWDDVMSELKRSRSGASSTTFATVPGTSPVTFPIFGSRTFAVDRTGVGVRVEPLSIEPIPEWDLLVASGRLDALNRGDVERLARAKWRDPILGLAAAYAAYAQRAWPYLALVIANLRTLEMNALDIELLSIAADLQDSDGRPEISRLERHHGDVPLFRWGVDLALQLFERADAPHDEWMSSLRAVQRLLWPMSVWTAWAEDPMMTGVR